MFTVEQIESAHSKVKTGADFPNYIKEIKELGVKSFETWVKDSHTEYFGENDFTPQNQNQNIDLAIADHWIKKSLFSSLKVIREERRII
jgi:hypothetical protein